MHSDNAGVRGAEVPAPRVGALARGAGALVSVLEASAIVLIVGMAIIVLTGVFYRYVIQRALPWYDEVAEYLLVWLTFYGSVLASHRNAHIGFEDLAQYVPRVLRPIYAVSAGVVVLLAQAALFYYGWALVGAASFDAAVSVRWLRLSWVYSAIPIGGGLMFLITLARLIRPVGPSRP